jgi:hypothetical protein
LQRLCFNSTKLLFQAHINSTQNAENQFSGTFSGFGKSHELDRENYPPLVTKRRPIRIFYVIYGKKIIMMTSGNHYGAFVKT